MPQTSPFASGAASAGRAAPASRTEAARRTEADRCPGVLRLAEAADGFLARVRLPGGLVSADQLRVLARLAASLGDGRVELTSRGNVQLRGLAATAAGTLTSELAEAGLLPSLSHDQVRNVLASPLAGLDGGDDLTALVRALDSALCARPRLAELSGRFLFALDDGRGDVTGPSADVPRADVAAIVRAGEVVVNGLAVPMPGAALPGAALPGAALPGAVLPGDHVPGVVGAMLACAEAFLDLRAQESGRAWRIADLPAGPERVRGAVAARLGLLPAAGQPDAGQPGAGHAGENQPGAGQPGAVTTRRPVGLVGLRGKGGGGELAASVRDDPGISGVLLAPLGRLTSAQLTWVAERVAGAGARITPWRSVVLPHLPGAAAVLAEAAGLGFGTDERSPWLRVTACAGQPGCASALADVQADAAGLAGRWPGRLVHVSGCGRHCGRPAATEIDVTATSEGYQVAGV